MRIGILEPDGFSKKAIDTLTSLGEVSFFRGKSIEPFLRDKHIVFIRLEYYINSDFLDMCPLLVCICSPTTGLNHIDLDEIGRRGIDIISLKGESDFLADIRATPEHIFGLTIALLRNYKDAFLNITNNKWDRNIYRGYEIYNNTFGIIGMGRIGRILSKYFLAFDARVLYYDKKKQVVSERLKGEKKVEKCDTIKGLISSADVIIMCASYEEGSRAFLNRELIGLMQEKYFINAARGELIDEDYLIESINRNLFKGVALDVVACEHLWEEKKHRFLDLVEGRNLIITPHIGGATYLSMERTEEFIANKLRKFGDGSCF